MSNLRKINLDLYKRAYRDPKSPLTPIVPLTTCSCCNISQNDSNFESKDISKFAEDKSRWRRILKENNYSEKFLEVPTTFDKPQLADNVNDTEVTPKLMRAKKYGKNLVTHYPQYFEMPRSQGYQECEAYLPNQNQLIAASAFQGNGIFDCAGKENAFRKEIKFYKCSPIPPKPLSPRISKLLTQIGMSQYRDIFEKEEIDLSILQLLTHQDLEVLGIDSVEDQNSLLKATRLTY